MFVPLSRLTTVLLAFFFLLTLSDCKHATEPQPIPEPPDTASAKTQVDIPWPGLANSPWPMIFHDPQHTGRSPHRGAQEGKVEWQFDAGGLVYSSPAIDEDGTVYFGSETGYFYAILPIGAEKWKRSNSGSDSSPLITSDGTIYTIQYPNLISYDRNGNLKWQYAVEPSDFLSSPSISQDGQIVYLASRYLYAIHKDGSLEWKVRPDTTDSFRYSLAVSPDGKTLYATGTKALYAIDVNGTLKWKFEGIFSNPAIDNDGNIYFGGGITPTAGGGSLYSLTTEGGVRWRRDDIAWGTEDPGPVIARDGTIYITGRALYAVDRVGNLKWNYDFVGENLLGQMSQCVPAIDIDGTIYVGKGTRRTAEDTVNFLAINPNGTLKFAMCLRCLDGSVPDISSRPAISADGKIYVGSDYPKGHYLFRIR